MNRANVAHMLLNATVLGAIMWRQSRESARSASLTGTCATPAKNVSPKRSPRARSDTSGPTTTTTRGAVASPLRGGGVAPPAAPSRLFSGAAASHQGAKRQREVGDVAARTKHASTARGPHARRVGRRRRALQGCGVATAAPRSRRRSTLGRRLLFGAADKSLSRCDDSSP